MRRLLLLLALTSCLMAAAPAISVQNRILAKVNGKPLTVVDVTKKMDLVFFREFAAYADSTEARMQFYQTNWRSFLEEMIDEQLILASAKELKVEATEGEIREEIEAIFGPDVIVNIDKANLTYTEVLEMVKNDMTVRRMVGSMVQAKASTAITPALTREAYEKYCKEHPQEKTWNYQVLSLRSKNTLESLTASQMAEELLQQSDITLEKLKSELTSRFPGITISLSDKLTRTPRTVSKSHLGTLQTLQEKQFSKPIDQSSASEGVYRIFHLDQCLPEQKIAFADIEGKLKTELLNDLMAEQSKAWRARLRERFGIDREYLDQMVPTGFQPFSLSKRATLSTQ